MAEKGQDDLLNRLRSGEKVVCPKCKGITIQPYNTTYDKAHWFECENCNFYIHCDPVIDIE